MKNAPEGSYGRATAAPLVLALLAAGCSSPQTRNVRDKGGTQVDQTADMVSSLAMKSFLEMVPDAVIEQAINEYMEFPTIHRERGYTLIANPRHEVFDMELCGPFGAVCWDALYSAYSCGELCGDADVDADTLPLLQEARGIIIGKAKNYLADPQALLAFYGAKKDVIVRTLKKHVKTEQDAEQLAKWVEQVEAALGVAMEPEFAKARGEYLETEQEHAGREEALYTCIQGKKPLGGAFAAYKACLAEDQTASDAYHNMRGSEDELRDLTPDFEISMFAARRLEEGGRPLVQAYQDIARDVRGEVRRIRPGGTMRRGR